MRFLLCLALAVSTAVAAVRAQADEEAARALADIAQADHASPEHPILAASLAQLAGPFSGFMSDGLRAALTCKEVDRYVFAR
ncbi:MAG: hypothetical protein AAB268_13605 [Elusimicrobiota bacterium]